MAQSPDTFLLLRRSFQDRLHVERTLIQLLDGNLLAAHMLSRLLDLHQTGGAPDVNPIIREDRAWWPLPWAWWKAELGVPERTGRRTLSMLRDRGFVQTRQALGKGGKVRLVWTVDLLTLVAKWEKALA